MVESNDCEIKGELLSFNTSFRETDLCIWSQCELREEALKIVLKCRSSLDDYVERYPSFRTALEPFPVKEDAPSIVKEMSKMTERVSVGPMAAVAGAIAQKVGEELLAITPEIIVENGGDIFIKVDRKKVINIYAGESPFIGEIALEIEPEDMPLGVCTSSGMLGHSFSFGRADAVIALAPSATLADAAATAICNQIMDVSDIPKGIEFAQRIDGLEGVVILKDNTMGRCGKVNLIGPKLFLQNRKVEIVSFS
ncbi:MAG: UPF0280 family protein [Spirochaetota bacterium]|nr:UPF0280 family protein [Spirochaetota bacterium]